MTDRTETNQPDAGVAERPAATKEAFSSHVTTVLKSAGQGMTLVSTMRMGVPERVQQIIRLQARSK